MPGVERQPLKKLKTTATTATSATGTTTSALSAGGVHLGNVRAIHLLRRPAASARLKSRMDGFSSFAAKGQ
jgi:hypothetical protein